MSTPAPPPQPDGIPSFLYGTAWKEDETHRLVRQALAAGFRGIDTANQRKHYHEAAVGTALAEAIAEGGVAREELFLQTKYTYIAGQDERLPYDPAASPTEQVRQSFASSLEHLGIERLDSYVLHGPSRRVGLGPEDLEVWEAMEALHEAGKTRFLGVSNVSHEQLEALCAHASVAPTFVQNRCFADRGWDHEVRALCRDRGLVYQGFSLLTANVPWLRKPEVQEMAARHERTVAQVVYRFAQQLGMLPLTGTTDPDHVREALDSEGFDLSSAELAGLERIALP